jgi:hypothetical protein
MANTAMLLRSLEKHGMKAAYYASDKKRQAREEMPVQDAYVGHTPLLDSYLSNAKT